MLKRITAIMVILTMVAFTGFTMRTSSLKANNGEKTTINIQYQDVAGYTDWLKGAKAEFEALYPNINVKLSCMPSTEGDYDTKTSLMLQTDKSIDAMVVDSFLVPSLVASDFLSPLPVSGWIDWTKQYSTSVKAGMTFNGKVFAVPYTTDTRGLYYNVDVFKKAGISVPWQPKNWADLLATIKKLHKAGVAYPIWMDASKAQGEGTTMQTFEMIMASTGDWIYENGKWVVKSPGLTSSLKFLQDIHDMGIYTNNELGTMLDANGWQTLNAKMPQSKEVGIALDGSWKGGDWMKALPKTSVNVIKVAKFPKQNGNGFASMSGGWTLAVSKLSSQKEAAFNFIKIAADRKNILSFTTKGGDMAVRKDVVGDPSYKNKDAYRATMSSFTDFTKFRPGVELYPSVSTEIQSEVEAVITGQLTAAKAAEVYRENVKSLAGDGNWVEK